MGDLNNLKSKCPATMLAANRILNVKGRMNLLTSSIKTIKGTKARGVPLGTKWAIALLELLKRFKEK